MTTQTNGGQATVPPSGPNRAARRASGPGLTAQVGAFSVDEFCHAHRISRALFYKMLAARCGPAIIKAGKRTLISAEAASAWRRRMEAATAEVAR